MRWDEWKFSARRALQDRFILWTAMVTVVLFAVASAYFLIRTLPHGWETGAVVLHYNIYLGIDEIMSWPWIFAVPGAALVVLALDFTVALSIFRLDPLASRVLISLGFFSILLWTIGCFFMAQVNL
jgi:hypothetical protein